MPGFIKGGAGVSREQQVPDVTEKSQVEYSKQPGSLTECGGEGEENSVSPWKAGVDTSGHYERLGG